MCPEQPVRQDAAFELCVNNDSNTWESQCRLERTLSDPTRSLHPTTTANYAELTINLLLFGFIKGVIKKKKGTREQTSKAAGNRIKQKVEKETETSWEKSLTMDRDTETERKNITRWSGLEQVSQLWMTFLRHLKSTWPVFFLPPVIISLSRSSSFTLPSPSVFPFNLSIIFHLGYTIDQIWVFVYYTSNDYNRNRLNVLK